MLQRVDQSIYLTEVKPDVPFASHADEMKEYIEPEDGSAGLPLKYYRLTKAPDEALPDEIIVDRLLDHRQGRDGTMESKTLWHGYPPSEYTW